MSSIANLQENVNTTAEFAQRYVSLGFGVTPLRPGKKAAYLPGWTNTSTPPEHWENHPHDGIAVIHNLSNTAALDIDKEDYARLALKEVGIDLDELVRSVLHVDTSRTRKLIFRIPNGLMLPHRRLTWPSPDKNGAAVVFELRAGAGKIEVLPPSIHPDTGRRYTWVPEPPKSRDDLPEIPPVLLDLWLRWDVYQPVLEGACPWGKPVTEHLVLRVEPRKTDDCAKKIIQKFNKTHSVEDLLIARGYSKSPYGRFVAPESSSGSPGVVITKTEERELVYSFHASDKLSDGHSHDAFDIVRILDYDGDWKRALEAAAQEVGERCLKKGNVVELANGEQIDLTAHEDSAGTLWSTALKNHDDETLLETVRKMTGLNIEEIGGYIDTLNRGRVVLRVDGREFEFSVSELRNFNYVLDTFAVLYGPVTNPNAKNIWAQSANIILELVRRKATRYPRYNTEDQIIEVLTEYFEDAADTAYYVESTKTDSAQRFHALQTRAPIVIDGRLAFHLTHFLSYVSFNRNQRLPADTVFRVLVKTGVELTSLRAQMRGKRVKRSYFVVPTTLYTPPPPPPEPSDDAPKHVSLRADMEAYEKEKAIEQDAAEAVREFRRYLDGENIVPVSKPERRGGGSESTTSTREVKDGAQEASEPENVTSQESVGGPEDVPTPEDVPPQDRVDEEAELTPSDDVSSETYDSDLAFNELGKEGPTEHLDAFAPPLLMPSNELPPQSVGENTPSAEQPPQSIEEPSQPNKRRRSAKKSSKKSSTERKTPVRRRRRNEDLIYEDLKPGETPIREFIRNKKLAARWNIEELLKNAVKLDPGKPFNPRNKTGHETTEGPSDHGMRIEITFNEEGEDAQFIVRFTNEQGSDNSTQEQP